MAMFGATLDLMAVFNRLTSDERESVLIKEATEKAAAHLENMVKRIFSTGVLPSIC